MENQLVSIITPLYNGERFIEQTILSVLAQTYQQWEWMIVDDGSTDRSAKIVKDFVKTDPRIHYIYQDNAGSASARNKGIRQASGRYITFIDADDVWDDIFLTEQIRFLQIHNCVLVYSAYRRINMDGNEILGHFIPPLKITKKDLLKSCAISCLTAVYDTFPYGKFYLRENLKSMRDDFVLWLDILDKCKIAYGNPNVLASYRLLTTSQTHNKKKVILPQFRVYRQIEKMGLLTSLYYLCHWAIRGFFKYRK